MKILVIQIKQLGDILTSSVIFEALKNKYPSSEIHYLIASKGIAMVENNPFVDKILFYDDQKKATSFFKNIFKIREQKYDIIIDAYCKTTTSLLCGLSGAKKTISFDKKISRLLCTDVIKRNTISFSVATKAIEHRLLLLEPIDIPFEVIKPKLYVTDEEKQQALSKLNAFDLQKKSKIIMISALGSGNSKTYPLQYMAKVLDSICQNTDATLLFNYIPNQKEDVLQLYKFCQPETQKQIKIDFYTKDLRDFFATVTYCKAVIGNEGGAINMAKALNVPTFAIFSPEILKNDWNLFENENSSISVHVDDYIPAFSSEQTSVHEKYDSFKPQFFNDKLVHFINYNL